MPGPSENPRPMPRPTIPDDEVRFVALRAQGAGGQHVNKASTAVQLIFDVHRSSLPDDVRARLLALPDRRIGTDGVITIKAGQFRSQALNRADARRRLEALVDAASHAPRVRRPTRPGRGAIERRLESKRQRSGIKTARRSRPEDDR